MKIDEVHDHIGEEWRVKWPGYISGGNGSTTRVRIDGVEKRRAERGYSATMRRYAKVTYLGATTGEPVEISGRNPSATGYVDASQLVEPWNQYAERSALARAKREEADLAAKTLNGAFNALGVEVRTREDGGAVRVPNLEPDQARRIADAIIGTVTELADIKERIQ